MGGLGVKVQHFPLTLPVVLTTLTLLCERDIINNNNNNEMAATRKEEKYVDLSARYLFEPIAVETLGVFNASARVLFDDLGRRITSSSGEAKETSFLYQRVSVLIQRYNAVLLHGSLPSTDRTD